MMHYTNFSDENLSLINSLLDHPVWPAVLAAANSKNQQIVHNNNYDYTMTAQTKASKK